MPPTVVFAARPEQRPEYEPHLRRAAAGRGLDFDLAMAPEDRDPAQTDYLIYAATGPVQDFAPYTRLKAILNLWAGVEAVLRLDPPRDVPLVRMVDPGMTMSMTEYVLGHVMRHHLNIDRYIGASPIAVWEKDFPPLARARTVAVLGLGALGSAAATALSQVGFRVIGWSRRPKSVPGVDARHGDAGLDATLTEAEILVLLLPHTPDTERLLNAERLAKLPAGACLINAARGPLIEHPALLEALDAGRLRHATMDVFDTEPLPPEDRYWTHPRVTVTPHIAAVTRPETASEVLIERILTAEAGLPLPHTVDRTEGY